MHRSELGPGPPAFRVGATPRCGTRRSCQDAAGIRVPQSLTPGRPSSCPEATPAHRAVPAASSRPTPCPHALQWRLLPRTPGTAPAGPCLHMEVSSQPTGVCVCSSLGWLVPAVPATVLGSCRMTARVCRETQGALALCSVVIHGSVHRVAFQHTALETPWPGAARSVRGQRWEPSNSLEGSEGGGGRHTERGRASFSGCRSATGLCAGPDGGACSRHADPC